jgi:hypothetical protein
LCSSIVIEEVQIESYESSSSREGRTVIAWEGRLDAESGQTIDLFESFPSPAGSAGTGFEDLGVTEGSELSVILISQFDGIGNQVTNFVFDGPLPIGPDWMGSGGSTDRDVCEKA